MSGAVASCGVNSSQQMLINGNSVDFGTPSRSADKGRCGGGGNDPLNPNGGEFDGSDLKMLDRQLKKMGIADPKQRMEKMAEMMGIAKDDLDSDALDFNEDGKTDGKDLSAIAKLAQQMGLKGDSLKSALKSLFSKADNKPEGSEECCTQKASDETSGPAESEAENSSAGAGSPPKTVTNGLADSFEDLVSQVRAAFKKGGSPKELMSSVMNILKDFGGNKLGVFKQTAT